MLAPFLDGGLNQNKPDYLRVSSRVLKSLDELERENRCLKQVEKFENCGRLNQGLARCED